MAILTYVKGRSQGSALAQEIAGNLAKSRWLIPACFEKAKTHGQQEQVRLRNETADAIAAMNQRWKQSVKDAIELRGSRPIKVDAKAHRASRRTRRLVTSDLSAIESDYNQAKTRTQSQFNADMQEMSDTHRAKMTRLETEIQAQWDAMVAEWKGIVEPIYASIGAANESAAKMFPPWEIPLWKDWEPPLEFQNAAKFGTLDVDMAKAAEAMPKDPRLALPGPAKFSVPLLLTYPLQGSILFETPKTGHDEAIAAINNIIFRLLSTNPAGKLSFTIFDPVGLGQNFAGLMHLADFEESHINSRIWTQAGQFEEKLARVERAHGKSHPDVSAQRIRNHRGIQRAGRHHRGEISHSRHRVLPGEFQRHRRQAPAQYRDQRRALRRLHAHPMGPAQCRAAGFRAGRTAQKQRDARAARK